MIDPAGQADPFQGEYIPQSDAVQNLDYQAYPVTAAFHNSDAFVRGLAGPIGPLSADTEFLTPQGWVRMDSYATGMKVCEWNHKTREARFTKPLDYIVNPCEEFIHFHNTHSLSMVLSEAHRVPHYDWKGEFKVKSALEVANGPSIRTIPVHFTLAHTSDTPLDIDLLRLDVMVKADGNQPKGAAQNFVRVCVRKERKKERIRSLLTAAGMEWKEQPINPNRPTEQTFTFYMPYRVNKVFQWEWLSLGTETMEVILDEIQHWDGLFEGSECRFISKHRQDAEIIQTMAHACGRRATINTFNDIRPNHSPRYTVHIAHTNSVKNKVKISSDHTTIERVPAEDGKMYCFVTNTSFFIARHNGRIFITGNSGKSVACVIEIIRRSQEQAPDPVDGIRRSRWAVIRNTYAELRDTTMNTFEDWIHPSMGRLKVAEFTYILSFNGCYAEVMFRALDRPDDVKKLLSLELTGAWINEAREIPKSILDMLQGRVGRYPSKRHGGPTWFGVIMDTNMMDTDHWWYTIFEESKPDTWDYFKQPSGLSPEAENVENLPDGYYTNLQVGHSKPWIDVYVHGKYGFVKDGKPVYPEYKDELHTVTGLIPYVPGYPLFVGIDFGLTPAAIVAQRINGQYRVLSEVVTENMGAARFSKELHRHFQLNYPKAVFAAITGDPAGVQRAQTDETTPFEILAANDIDCDPALTNDFTIRTETVSMLLSTLTMSGEPALIVSSEGAPQFRKAMAGGYKYKRIQVSGDERFHDVPDKNRYSHPAEAGQYLFLGAGEDHKVVTPQGSQEANGRKVKKPTVTRGRSKIRGKR